MSRRRRHRAPHVVHRSAVGFPPRRRAALLIPAVALLTAGSVEQAPPGDSPATHAYAWGDNSSGVLTVGGVARAMSPVPVDLPAGITDLGGGDDFAVALTASGVVWTWGGNAFGQLGDGTTAASSEPEPVTLAGTAVDVAVGARHVLVLTDDHRVLSWGSNGHGQLGDGSTIDRASPTDVDVPGDVVDVAAGNDVSLATTSDGSLYAWGQGDAGQLGSGSQDALTPVAVTLPPGTRVVDADTGLHQTVAATAAGQLLAWGRDVRGYPLPLPMSVDTAHGSIVQVAAGDNHLVALTDRGTVLTFGDDTHGQLGDGDGIDASRIRTPGEVVFTGATGPIVAISAGGNHTLALTSTGQVFTWGGNRYGEVGDGSLVDVTAPLLVSDLTGAAVDAVHAGRYDSIVTVTHGAPARLRLTITPPVIAGSPFDVVAEVVDPFGNVLGRTDDATLTMDNGTCDALRCRSEIPGARVVRGVLGRLRGSATVVVEAPPPPPTTTSSTVTTTTAVSTTTTGAGTATTTIDAPTTTTGGAPTTTSVARRPAPRQQTSGRNGALPITGTTVAVVLVIAGVLAALGVIIRTVAGRRAS